jgi:hypothetical protein
LRKEVCTANFSAWRPVDRERARSRVAARKRARTWIALTAAGTAALREEIDQLKLLIRQVDGTAG